MSVSGLLGLQSLQLASWDARILIAQRFLRMLAYGQTALILGLFFQTLDVTDDKIGMFMSLTLLGDVLISWILTFHADGLGRRFVLKLGAFAMALSGVVFAISSNYWLLLLAAVIGVISPSGDETGPFKAIEESTLVHLTHVDNLPDLFAWHGIIGTVGSALGSLSAGFIVGSYGDFGLRLIFWSYAAIASVKYATSFCLSEACENSEEVIANVGSDISDVNSINETTGLLSRDTTGAELDQQQEQPRTHASRALIITLCFLFGLDSLGYGFMNNSWLVVYFVRRFSIPEATLGTVLFCTMLVGSFTQIFSSHLSKALGPILAMVFAKLPSAMAGTAVGLVPNATVAIVLLLIRTATDPMDVVPRQLFLSTFVAAEDRTKVMGAVNVVKTLAKTVGPYVTGILASRDLFWVAFMLVGVFEGAYAVSLLFVGFWMKRRH